MDEAIPQQLRLAFELLDEPILVVDHHGRMVVGNRAMGRWLRIPAAQSLIGKSLTDFFPELSVEVLDTLTRTTDVSAGQTKHSTTVRPLTGESSAVVLAITPGMIEGRPIHVIKIPPTGAAALATRDRFAATRISGELLASRLGHELANLVTPMLGYVELAQVDLRAAGDPQELFDTLMGLNRRLYILVQNLLFLRQREVGATRRSSLAAVLAAAVKIVQQTGLLKAHDVVISNQTGDPTLQVIGDNDQLRQLFICLILNAAEAMVHPGKIEIILQANPAGITVTIADTGPGIAEELREKVFEPLFSAKGKNKGVGLGLYVARNIAERHRARITLDANQPCGARVTVHFAPG